LSLTFVGETIVTVKIINKIRAKTKTCISGITTHSTIIKSNKVVFVIMLIILVKAPFTLKWIKLIHPLKNMARPPDKNHISSSADVSPELSKSGYIRCAMA
jgi:hypothetical protein